MSGQVLLQSPVEPVAAMPTLEVPTSFKISSQDKRLRNEHKELAEAAAPPLGVLEHFKGTFAGTGLNLIFRPNSGQTKFPNPLDSSLPAPPNPPNENVLEINLTSETLSFSQPLGTVPNRGLEKQRDINLNGVPYVQSINDVTNVETGKGNNTPSAIHYEPGVWMHVPATTVDPVLVASLTRMASIPHGTTINAQGVAPTTTVSGPPPFTGPNALPKVDITPFLIGNPASRIRFASQTASATNTPRLPQDLSAFIKTRTITQDILDNPNLVLANAIEGQNITKTTVFTVSTTATAPFKAGGTANIDFLQGSTVGVQSGPNASAVNMSATFWVEEVQCKLEVPAFHGGDAAVHIKAVPTNSQTHHTPTFRVSRPRDLEEPRTINAKFTQIQYMQNVSLNFAGLTWPHVSCATLIPSAPIPVPASAFD